MSDVTIVTEDAERLVREGGVVNRSEGPPGYWCYEAREWLRPEWPHTCSVSGRHEPITTPFTVDVRERRYLSAVHGEEAGQVKGRTVGTVAAVDVHHADDCPGPTMDDWCPTCNSYLMSLGVTEPCDDDHFCHPDARPNMWHWKVSAGNEDEG